jgi:hypothetical protein
VYVESSGRRLGYWDNKTQTAVLDDESDRAAFVAALANHGNGAGERSSLPSGAATAIAVPSQYAPGHGNAAAPAVVPTGQPTLQADHPPVADLAATRPGQLAREQAIALRTAAPVRTFVQRALGVKSDERAWRIGALGEESVGKQLAKLGDDWKVLHAVPIGDRGSDIDHVVIGPTGVYTINTKHHPSAKIWVGGDTFLVNGQRQPYVRNSRFEASRAAKLLTRAIGSPVEVMGLIALVNVAEVTIKRQPTDGTVYVLQRIKLRSWLNAQSVRMSNAEVDALYSVARRPGTWCSKQS